MGKVNVLILNDKHIGILAELYWNGSQFSRTTPDLRKEIEELIEEGFIEERRTFFKVLRWQWCVRLTEAGAKVHMAMDPVRVFNHYMRTADSSRTLPAACATVAKFTLDQLPTALAHENEEVREAAAERLRELSRGPYYCEANG